MDFEFATANRIIFGAGRVREIGYLAASFGARAIVITGERALSNAGVVERLKQYLEEKGVEFLQFSLVGEPDIDTLELGVAKAHEGNCDLVISDTPAWACRLTTR